MVRYSKNPNAPSAEDKALDRFTDLMIDKIKSIKEDWQRSEEHTSELQSR